MHFGRVLIASEGWAPGVGSCRKGGNVDQSRVDPAIEQMLASSLSSASDPSLEYVPHPEPSKPYWLAEAGEKHAKYTNFRSTEALPESTQVVIIGAS